jgi:hypothetical protein
VRQRANDTHTVGIDVDRDVLVVAHYRSNAPYAAIDEFPNFPQGYQALVTCLTGFDAPQMICLESTGPYSAPSSSLSSC